MSQSSGNSTMPVVAIVGALALSAAVFFLVTLPTCSKDKDEVADNNEETKPPVEPVVEPEPEPAPPEPEPEPEPEPKAPSFASPQELVSDLAKHLTAGDLDKVKALVDEDVLAEPRALGFLHTFGEGGYALSPTRPFAEIGKVDEVNRWALYVMPSAASPDDLSAQERITVDMVMAPEVGFKVSGIHVPEVLRQQAVVAGIRLPDGTTGEGGISPDRADPLFVADDFVTSLLSQNFEKALSLCGDKVLDEKIAGLCMVFEEGGFQLVDDKPLTQTSLGADKANAWVYARVISEALGKADFGVEMDRDPESGWEIKNVHIESMLQKFVKASEAGKVPFTPIKQNPDGGDTLVLYFELDKAGLLPRSLRQLDILARILKADPSKKLNIGGHADNLGTDEYNRKLSEGRASSVRLALIEFGVPETQIETTAFGEAKPWKKNELADGTDNPEGRQHNRRAEIYLNF